MIHEIALMPKSDPLAVIETDTPSFSTDEVIGVVLDHYGLSVSATPLVSERDQNFHLSCENGEQYVLKIANALEDPDVTHFQIQALLHIESTTVQNGLALNTPTVLSTREGLHSLVLTSGHGKHVARVVSYVDGVPLGDRMPSAKLCEHMGRYLANLGLALREFQHSGASQALLWDMQQALSLRELLPCIKGKALRERIVTTLRDFEENALPFFAELRTQVIHSDFNPDNVLIAVDKPDSVVGVIDFGDMLRAPLIIDVAIAASYLRPDSGNPLALIAEFLTGYHRAAPLTQLELEVLFTLIKTRLAASIAILHWRCASKRADDPYLRKHLGSESQAEFFLARLSEMPADNVTPIFRQVCAAGTMTD